MNISCLRVILWDKEDQLLGICEQRGRSYVDFMGAVLDKIDTLDTQHHSAETITVKEVGHLKSNTIRFDIHNVSNQSRVELLRSIYSQLS